MKQLPKLLRLRVLFVLILGTLIANIQSAKERPIPTRENFFGGSTIEFDPSTYKPEDPIPNTNDCIVPEKDALKLLKEKYKIDYTKPYDPNLGFILGKCSPTVFVPGIYATRLVININCKKLKAENFDYFIQSRIYCGNSVCKDENNENEEHVLFPALFGSPFTLKTGRLNKKSVCVGYYMKFFNNKDECAKTEDGENVCNYSDAVRISFYGGTEKTVKESQCGLKAVGNVVSTEGTVIPESIVNSGAGSVFKEMIDKYRALGYVEGFSYGAVPLDYRRFIANNKFAQEAIKYQVNQLYENTGKPVVIIAHSFGTLNTLNKIAQSEPEFLKKIKKFIALTPPFAGASKLLDVFLYGSQDFDTEIKVAGIDVLKVKFDPFGQSLAYNSVPLLAELKPQSVFAKMFADPKHADFKNAIEEAINVEKECGDTNCSKEKIDALTPTFRKIYGDILPSLADSECQVETAEGNSISPFTKPCRTYLYDAVNCPTVGMENSTHQMSVDDLLEKCGSKDDYLLYNDVCPTESAKAQAIKFLSILTDENEQQKQCVDSIYGKAPYPFDKTNLDSFIDNFNKLYSKQYNITVDRSFFESKEKFQIKMTALVKEYERISKTQDLPFPGVDTVLIYSNFLPTSAAFVYDGNEYKTKFDNDEVIARGGDGTVPNYSSYLTGLKWLYEKATDETKTSNITLVEYCSPLSKPGGKYAYSPKTTKSFYGLGCDCINSDYKSYKTSKLDNYECMHSTVLSDDVVIDYIRDEFLFDENSKEIVTEQKVKSINAFVPSEDFLKKCNEELRNLLIQDMDKV